MGLLDKINSPEELKTLDESQLDALCEELRTFVIDNVSKTGGHLASNLGAVELTVAIHRVFNTKKDRLLFDVGHQSYIHKILTGRKAAFSTLRQFGGLAGFPKPTESVHDSFIAGHASAAISEALGMARARTRLGEDYSVIALLGDGALTGGLAYEALCDAGASGEPLIVILNNNGMSIADNVGAMACHLSHLRMKKGYLRVKEIYRRLILKFPGGRYVYNFTHRIKQSIKTAIFKCSMFEDMGFTYIGPVDGHNIGQLTLALELAKSQNEPVLVHVITTKGKGYRFAEENPNSYHGVPPFDPVTGFVPPVSMNFSDVMGSELTSMAEENNRIIAITAAMPTGTGLTGFAEAYPDRFFDVGIAEGHAVAMAAGAAHQGLVPVVAIYSTFLQRSYDMLIHDIGISGEHVVLCVDKAGLVGEDGETHHGAFDVSYLRSVPGMTILSPASFDELRDMLHFAVNKLTGPVAIRYPKGGEGSYTGGDTAPSKLLRRGEDFTIVTYGTSVNDALAAADILSEKDITVDVLKLGFIKPIDFDAIAESVRRTGRLLVLEECCACGCVGEQIAAWLTSQGQSPRRLILKNLGDNYITHGKADVLRASCGLDAESIAGEIAASLPRKNR